MEYRQLEKLKVDLARKLKLGKTPKNIDVRLDSNLDLKTKPIRTMSGVAPVAIMTKPEKCPHGKCTFCPGGPNSFFGDVPMSYTGNEPASMRAIRNKYDAYLQVFNRLEHYTLLNQFPGKVELIIMGGTFASYPIEYQDEFIRDAFKAMNDFGEMFFDDNGLKVDKFKEFFELPGDVKSEKRKIKIHEKVLKLKKDSSLEEEQVRNEKARVRCTLMVIETKPDWCFEEHINQILKLGGTRVEIGIQTLNDEILKKVNRGHTLADSIKATQLLKDCGLKVVYHMMPGLPGSTKEEDINNFKEIFENENYKPDALKIYPCMVMPGTPLEKQYEKGLFKPLSTEEAGEVVRECKKLVPEYCRIMRILRDIPTKVTIDGVGMTNFRQYVHQLMEKNNEKCRCIRCREPMKKEISDEIELKRLDYDSSGGKEVFLSFEDTKNDILLGFVRLRKPSKPFRKEIGKNDVLIREIHVYGESAKLGEEGRIQHKGYGKKLMLEAENVAREFNAENILVLSGIGTKEYFRKLGYSNNGIYVSKKL